MTSGKASDDDFHPIRVAKYWQEYSKAATRLNFDNTQQALDTIMQLYTRRVSEAPRAMRSDNVMPVYRHLENAAHLSSFRDYGSNIFLISKPVQQAMKRTTLKGMRIGDLKMPFPSLYIGFEGGSDLFLQSNEAPEGCEIDGCYVTLWQNDVEAHFTACLTSRAKPAPDEAEAGKYWPLAIELNYTFLLEGSLEQSFDELFAQHLASLEDEKRAADERRVQMQRDADQRNYEINGGIPYVTVAKETGTQREIRIKMENREVASKALALVLGAIFLLTSKTDAGADLPALEWPEGIPGHIKTTLTTGAPKAQRSALGEMNRRGILPVRTIVLDEDEERQLQTRSSGGGDAKGRAAHWRTGHFRRQTFGEGMTQTKIIWIMPTFVTGDASDADARIHRVITKAEKNSEAE